MTDGPSWVQIALECAAMLVIVPSVFTVLVNLFSRRLDDLDCRSSKLRNFPK